MGRYIGEVLEAKLYEDEYMDITFLELRTAYDVEKNYIGYLVPFFTGNLGEEITEENFGSCLERWADEGAQLWEEFGGGHFSYSLLWNEEHPYIDSQPIDSTEISLSLVKMIAASVLKKVRWPIIVSGFLNNFTDAVVIEEVEDDDGYTREIERESAPYFECRTDIFFGESELLHEYKKLTGATERGKIEKSAGEAEESEDIPEEEVPF